MSAPNNRSDFVRRVVGRGLVSLGRLLPISATDRLDRLIDLLDTGRWLRANGFEATPWLERREEMWEQAGLEIGERAALYLEFGVFRGYSLRYWSHLMPNSNSHLAGFDSFRGLPEDWKAVMPSGALDVGGALPKIADPRVTLHPGWFEETLPSYQPPAHEVMVVNIDADLYSSTIYVLNRIRNWFKAGDYLYLDDFFNRHHVRRAFDEFRENSGVSFKPRWFCFGNGLFQVDRPAAPDCSDSRA